MKKLFGQLKRAFNKRSFVFIAASKREEASINLAVVKPTIKIIDLCYYNFSPQNLLILELYFAIGLL